MSRESLLHKEQEGWTDCEWHLLQRDDGLLEVRFMNFTDHFENWRVPLDRVLAGARGERAKEIVQKGMARLADEEQSDK